MSCTVCYEDFVFSSTRSCCKQASRCFDGQVEILAEDRLFNKDSDLVRKICHPRMQFAHLIHWVQLGVPGRNIQIPGILTHLFNPSERVQNLQYEVLQSLQALWTLSSSLHWNASNIVYRRGLNGQKLKLNISNALLFSNLKQKLATFIKLIFSHIC